MINERGRTVVMKLDELRQMAAYFRLLATDSQDMHMVVVFRQLAEEFDAEAANVAAREATSEG